MSRATLALTMSGVFSAGALQAQTPIDLCRPAPGTWSRG
jgi:hypothetical protein